MSLSKGFKVVSREDEKLVSCAITNVNSVVEYKLDEWVQPNKKDGPLAVFNFLAEAETFRDLNLPFSDIEIWKCEFKPSDEVDLWMDKMEPEDMKGHPFYGQKFTTQGEDLPNGTALASEVKLLEKVREYPYAE